MTVAGRRKAAFFIKSLRPEVVLPYAKPQGIGATGNRAVFAGIRQQVRKAAAVIFLQDVEALQFHGLISGKCKGWCFGFPLCVAGGIAGFIFTQENKNGVVGEEFPESVFVIGLGQVAFHISGGAGAGKSFLKRIGGEARERRHICHCSAAQRKFHSSPKVAPVARVSLGPQKIFFLSVARIVIIGSAHPLRGGGISTFNERLAKALDEAGHEAVIESFSLQYPSFLFPGKSQFTDDPPPPGLRIRSRINSINPLSWWRVGQALRREKPDLIIARYWIPFMGPAFGTILRLAKKNRHTRVISILDNFIPHEGRPGDKAFTRYFAGPVDAFVTMSRQVLGEVSAALPQKPAAFTPHPVYDNYGEAVPRAAACRKLGLDAGKKYLLFFGFIRAYKGLDLLLQALPLVKDPDIHLIIAGEYYGDPAPYESLISGNNLEDRVHRFTDFIPTEDVRYFFSAADLVVQPYKSATNSGITQVAYHFEKPMVVTNVGGLPEVVPDGKAGFVVAPEPEAIAAGIERFFSGNYGAQMQSGLRDEKRKYSWDTFVEVLLKTAGI